MSIQRFWTCAPQLLRAGLLVSAIVAMIFGGSAGAYWD
jgi:hypothetical protein